MYYPSRLLNYLRERGVEFLEVAPMADDLWIHYVALLNGIKVGQVYEHSVHFPVVPHPFKSGLQTINVTLGGNDQVVSRLYDETALVDRLSCDERG